MPQLPSSRQDLSVHYFFNLGRLGVSRTGPDLPHQKEASWKPYPRTIHQLPVPQAALPLDQNRRYGISKQLNTLAHGQVATLERQH